VKEGAGVPHHIGGHAEARQHAAARPAE
jgi:hypothetical protein